MSRVGKKPIPVPEKAKITYNNHLLTVQSEKGTLALTVHPDIDLMIEDGLITVTVRGGDKKSKALWGTTRALVANMIAGVTEGFTRVLEINGIGYRAELKGNSIDLHLGYSHPINYPLPDGITAQVDKAGIRLSGIDKGLLGFAASSIRRFRPPEPYKGKGIKYAEEIIQRKAGKTAK